MAYTRMVVIQILHPSDSLNLKTHAFDRGNVMLANVSWLASLSVQKCMRVGGNKSSLITFV